MKKIHLAALSFSCLLPYGLYANTALSSNTLWQSINTESNLHFKASNATDAHETQKNINVVKLNQEQLIKQLSFTGLSFRGLPQSEITLPLPNGDEITVVAQTKTVMNESLAKQYPNIQHWQVQGKDDPRISGVMDITPLGFHAMLDMPDGETVFIDPYKQIHRDDSDTLANADNYYLSRHKGQGLSHKDPLLCNADKTDKGMAHQLLLRSASAQTSPQSSPLLSFKDANTREQITYRLAIAATGEYTRYHGGKEQALAAITTTISRVNQVYKRDLNIQLKLVSGNDKIIYTDPINDPFSPSFPTMVVDQSITAINDTIGANNYDIGHVFGQGSSYGVAFTAATCMNDFKAGAYSSSSDPVGDNFDIDYVAHEIGHQLGGTHVFNSETGSCGGGTRTAKTAVEPGSGSSIMSYAGICWPNNIATHSEPMFHIANINQIDDYTRNGVGTTCGIRDQTDTNNNPIITETPQEFSIPAGTSFRLSGKAIDTDIDEMLTYSWEQVDTGKASEMGIDTGDNALFRTYLPTFSPEREFPHVKQQQSLFTSPGETLPTTDRDMTFKFVVRDNRGGIAEKTTLIHIIKNSDETFGIHDHSPLLSGQKASINWHVANTNLYPFNCNRVNIDLSTNSGVSYNHNLAEAVDNNGTLDIKMPSVELNAGSRLKLSCTDSIFFHTTRSAKTGTMSLATTNNVSDEPTTEDTATTNSDEKPDTNEADNTLPSQESNTNSENSTENDASNTVSPNNKSSDGGGALPLVLFGLLWLRRKSPM